MRTASHIPCEAVLITEPVRSMEAWRASGSARSWLHRCELVQRMLGHKSATMTLDLYGRLFADRLDTVADALDTARTAELPARDELTLTDQ